MIDFKVLGVATNSTSLGCEWYKQILAYLNAILTSTFRTLLSHIYPIFITRDIPLALLYLIHRSMCSPLCTGPYNSEKV